MTIGPDRIRAAVEKRLGEATKLLGDIIAIPSLDGEEAAVMDFAFDAFSGIAEVEKVELSDALREDELYSDPIPSIDYDGRYNIRAVIEGVGKGECRNLLLSSHIDTVPPSQGQIDPYNAQIRDGLIWGRGSCDAKGQIATIWLTMAVMRDLGLKCGGDLIGHVVVEEENGGNGTLAMARRGEDADGCVILEPTELKVLTSIRGAIWFRITVRGKPGHSGMAGKTRSALKMAIRVMEILEGYHADLLAKSRGFELFDKHENPMPLTIGQFNAGNWPATAPGEATLAGVLGLLPNKTANDVIKEMTEAIRSQGGNDIADNFDIHFMYRHDCSVIPTNHALAVGLRSALTGMGETGEIDAMTASCDAFFYNNINKIPTLVFGGGSLSVAHSNTEHMPLDELRRASEALVALAASWCG